MIAIDFEKIKICVTNKTLENMKFKLKNQKKTFPIIKKSFVVVYEPYSHSLVGTLHLPFNLSIPHTYTKVLLNERVTVKKYEKVQRVPPIRL